MLLSSRGVAGKPKAAVSSLLLSHCSPSSSLGCRCELSTQNGELACSAACQVLGGRLHPRHLSLHPAQMQGMSFCDCLLADSCMA